MATLARILAIAFSVALCAALSGLAALQAQLLTLSPSDGAYGQSLIMSLSDPMVRDTWLFVTGSVGGVGLLFALPMLWRVQLIRAVPVVIAVSVAASFVTGAALSCFSAFAAPLFALFALAWTTTRVEWRLPSES